MNSIIVDVPCDSPIEDVFALTVLYKRAQEYVDAGYTSLDRIISDYNKKAARAAR